MNLGGLTPAEYEQLRIAFAQSARAPAQSFERRTAALTWFPSTLLASWFAAGDGTEPSTALHLFSLDDALRARRELLLRDLGPPLTSREQFLPLARCPEGLLIFDGAADGLVLRRTRDVAAYSRARAAPLPLALLAPNLPTAASAPSQPAQKAVERAAVLEQFFRRPMTLAWLGATAEVTVTFSLELGQTAPTARQGRLLAELAAHDGAIRAHLEAALFSYYQSIRGLTDYGSPEVQADLEPTLEAPNAIWPLLSSPEVWVDPDDGAGNETPGFEISWCATFDDEHGAAVRVEDWKVWGVGSPSACEPLARVQQRASDRTR